MMPETIGIATLWTLIEAGAATLRDGRDALPVWTVFKDSVPLATIVRGWERADERVWVHVQVGTFLAVAGADLVASVTDGLSRDFPIDDPPEVRPIDDPLATEALIGILLSEQGVEKAVTLPYGREDDGSPRFGEQRWWDSTNYVPPRDVEIIRPALTAEGRARMAKWNISVDEMVAHLRAEGFVLALF